jgi:hypothetical protein
MAKKLAAHVFAWVIWVALLWGFWLLLVGEWTGTEAVWGLGVAAVVAGAAEAVRAHGVGSLRLPVRWLARAWSVPPMVLVDFGVITWLLVRATVRRERIEGKFRMKPLAPDAREPDAHALRAWITLAATYSPNAYVVDMDPDQGTVLLHDLITIDASDQPA